MSHTLTATHVEVTRLAGHIGGELGGVDTGAPLSDEVIAKIRQALLDHKVVFLRGQSLNYRRQVAFAERLGPLTLGHPTLASPPGQPGDSDMRGSEGMGHGSTPFGSRGLAVRVRARAHAHPARAVR